MGFEIKNGILIRSENYEEEIILPAGIREIGENAFHADYTWLEGGDAICRIVLPDGVKKDRRPCFCRQSESGQHKHS